MSVSSLIITVAAVYEKHHEGTERKDDDGDDF